ncbi:TonB-dependent receptor [Parahaliea aestuarii]|uniref:TonB-dependent receptor n=1 Tax=Parahaliea aestuarii TaxID=1852021 RepID=A0A5C8ZN59_9GAMM|nr:TonB-dependent receptor [Parahaliea aestuarii]TXS89192.1 TonB-dependent receptor [Parahaliea aestuarii]
MSAIVKFKPLALPAALLAALSGTASAQVLEEVVVTAQKRVEGLQDVPISISAVGGEKLNDAGITRMADLQTMVPNLTMSEAGIGSNVYIRGVGSQVNQGFEQSVGTYVDGIYYGRPRQLRQPFFDLARIEVLRGPQGILFGKNSIAGALNLVTNRPSDEFELQLSGLYEPRHDEIDTSLIVSGPLTDTLAGRLALRKREMGGYIENIGENRDEMETDEWVGRAVLEWNPTADLTLTLKGELGTFDSIGRNSVIIGDAVSPAVTPVVNDYTKKGSIDPEYSNNEYETYTLTAGYALGDYELTAITGYSGYDYDEQIDTDFGMASFLQSPASEDFEQISQEIRLASPVGETFEYIVGVFYQGSETEYVEPVRLDLPTVNVMLDRDYYSDSDVWAAFGQLTWNLSASLRATVGLRYTEESKEGGRQLVLRNPDGTVFNPLGLPAFSELGMPLPPLGLYPHDLDGERDEEVVTPMLNLQWDVSDQTMLYASASTGYKAGGFDARSNRGVLPDGSDALEFEEEQALAFEVGGKLGLLDGAAELNIAAFYTEYDDLQVSVFDGVLGFDVQNAASATTQGVELDGRWQATEYLTLSAALAYTDFAFDDYANGACYKGQVPSQVIDGVPFCNWDGNTNQFTPEWSGNLGAEFYFPLGGNLELRAALDLMYSGEYFAAPDLDPNAVQDDYIKVNARLGLGSQDGTWEVALVGRNLTDEEILTFANDVPLSGAATSYFAFVERPATVALQAQYRF